MGWKKYGIFVLLWVISSLSFSQTVAENCNNGVDDDGDGLIDCNDPDCQYPANIEKGCNCDDDIDNDGDGNADEFDGECARFYGLEFIGEDTDCSVVPDVTGTFDMAPPIRSGQNTTDTQSKLAIGDMDGDGIPDVVFVSKWNQTIRVMATTDNQADGSDEGDIKSDYKTPGKNIFPKGKGFDAGWYFELEISIADIDGDGIGEVFGIASNRKNANDEPSNYVLVGFTYAAGSLVPLWNSTLIGQDRPGEIAVADFDGDGLVEILIKDQIYAAETGELLADGNLGDWNAEVNSAPVAVDIFPGGNMELVTGNIILNVPNLVRGMVQVLTVAADMNTLGQGQWFPKEIFDANEYGFDNFSSTSVADLSGDGLLDVVLSGAVGSKNGQTAVFFWNVATGVVDYFEADDAGEPNGWKWGTSRPNLGEIDGDGKLEITFIAGNQLFALEEVAGTLVEKWRRTINDSRSGIVATTVYDFDNDGNPEIVYRDSQQLTIVDGETGATVKWATTCQSHTMMEGPIIADVNGDGNTDLCVPCNRSTSFDINDPIQQQALGEMRCFFSEGTAWLPTRKVWNQTGYYVTNIKDDLQVPFPQMGMTTVLGTGNCANGLPGPQKPFNTFLNQIPYLGPNGCPIFPGPDLAFFGDDPDDPNIDKNDPSYLPAVEVIPPICGNLGIIVKFNIINSGSLPISQNVDVSFWEKDPTTDPSAVLLHTGVVTVSGLDVGDTIQTAGIPFDGPGYQFPLFIVLNDDGSTPPIIDLSVNLNEECFIDNNVFDVVVGPTPFDVVVTSTDNFKCDDTAPDNGQLQATISIGGLPVVDLSNYSFQWYEGTDDSTPIPAPTGTQQILTNVDQGDYGVIITDTDKGCASDLVIGSVSRQGVDPDITMDVISDQTQCFPANGELKANITGGDAGYTFQWFDDLGNDLGFATSNLPGRTEGNYTVIVSKDGCSKPALGSILGPVEPEASATATGVSSCSDPNSGTVTATALVGGVVAPDQSIYDFEWHYYDNIGSVVGSILPPINGTGASRTGLSTGWYAVYSTNTQTGCTSIIPVSVEVEDDTDFPSVIITEVDPVTSCDPSQPNGVLAADVVDGGGNVLDPADYTFVWYVGDNTLPANQHFTTSGTNDRIAEDVQGGGIFYTVEVTNLNSCATTNKLIISENINEPVVNLALLSSNTVCDPLLAASGAFTGSTQASVTFEGISVTLPDPNYTFVWHDGATTSDPVIAVGDPTSPVLSELEDGEYTVVVTRNDLFCPSLPVTILIPAEQVPPVLEETIVGATNCLPAGVDNGSATVLVNEAGTLVSAGYSYEWFVGPDTSGAAHLNTSGANDETAIGLAPNGTYTAQVTNIDKGCTNTITLFVPDDSELPTVTLIGGANSICDPGLIYNGSITAGVNDVNNPAGPVISDFTDYTFSWEDNLGNDVLTSIAGSSASDNILSNIPGGTYNVTVTNNVLGCTSDVVQIVVPDQQLLPIINIADVASTNCDPALPNGSLTASVDETARPSPVNGYTFEWYAGGTASGAVLSAAALLPNVNGGQDYTVLVRNEDTGCESTQTFSLPDASAKPLLTLTPITNSVCDISYGFTGGITASVDDINNGGVQGSPFSDYSFTWEDNLGNDVLVTIAGSSATENVLSNVPGGIYTVTVTNTVLGCSSDPVNVTVPDQQLLPIINIADVASTNCDPALPNGSLTASVDETARPSPVNGYTFEWYAGGTASGAVLSAAALLPNVNGGQDYTVLVRNEDTGCESTQTFSLPDASAKPLLTLTPITNSVCDISYGFTGGITASVDDTNNGGVQGSPFSDYSFTWEDNLGNDVLVTIAGSSATENVLSNVPGGIYTVTVTNTVLGCSSDPVNVTVPDQQLLPIINIADVASTNCDPALPNGSLTASVDETARPSPVNGYTFEWYAGGTASGAVLSAAALLPNVNGGQDYTVLVRNEDTGCESTQTFSLPDASAKPLLTLTPITNSVCDISYGFTGGITASVDDTNNGGVQGSPFSDYSFTWEDNLGNDVLVTIAGSSATENVLSNVPGGIYTVTVTNTVLGCSSDPVNVTVPDQQLLPIINIADVASTNCDPALPNGSLTASVDETARPSPVNGYTFEWYAGGTASGAVLSAAALLPNVNGGQDYTVLVRNEDTGCESTQTFSLPDASAKPLLTLTPITNSVCDISYGFSGGITASVDDTNNGGVQGSPFSDYSFTWEDNLGNDVLVTIAGSSATENVLSNVPGGIYTVTVTNTVLGCSSDPVNVTVPDQQLLPIINIADVASTNCDPALPNGSLTASVDETARPSPVNGYTFEWYAGGTASGAVLSAAALLPNVNGGQDYTVLVRNEDTGCESTQTFSLPDASAKPSVVLVATPNSVCGGGTDLFNGTITVGITDNNHPGGPAIDLPSEIADFSFQWINSSGTDATTLPGVTIHPDGNILEQLPDDTYTITVTNTLTGCVSVSQSIILPKTIILPSPLITIVQDQNSCDPAAPNGSVSADGDGVGTTTGFQFEWFVGNNTSVPFINGTHGTIGGSEGQILSDLITGDYSVRVTDLGTGCVNFVSKNVPETIIIPNVDLVLMNPNTVCDDSDPGIDFNGDIEVEINGGAVILPDANFELTWYLGETTADPVLVTIDGSTLTTGNPTVATLEAGKYTVVVLDKSSTCTSQPLTVEVTEVLQTPTILLTDTDQTSCNPLTLNGTLQMDAGGSPGPYTITLYSGTDLTGAQISTANSVVTDSQNALPSGNYTVQVVDETTGCAAQASIFINEIIERPLLTASVTAPITDCTLDGEITPDITNSATIPAPLGYQFDWYEGPDTSGGIYASTTGNNGDASTILSTANAGVNIYSGFYTVVATDIDANCSTDPFTIFLDRPLPLLTLKFKVNFEPSDCNQNTGIVTGWVDVDGDDDPYDPLEVPDYTKYSFEWYIGNPTDPNVNYFTNPPPVFNPADQLDVDLNDRYNSAPGGAGVKDTDYFDNFSVDNGATLYDVADGRYTMVVTDLANGCKEFIPIDIRFQDSQVTTLVTVSDVTSCIVDNGTIDVTVTNTNGFSQIDYDIFLYSGNNITGPSIASGKRGGYISDFSIDDNRWSTIRGTATGDVDGISGVNDVLEFYANASGGNHRLLKSMFIPGNLYDISFDFFIPATNTNVDGISVRLGSGTVLSNQLGVTGVWTTVTLNNVNVNNQELRIFSMTGASDGFFGANLPTDDVFYIKNFVATDLSPPLFENLTVGVYTINSQQEFGSNCLSTPVTIVIDSAARQPVVSATIVDNDDCNLGNGSISATALPGPLDTAPLSGVSYSYSWSSTEPINPGEVNTPTITSLNPGDYTVQVSDDNTQCVITRTFTVDDQPTIPDIVQITATPNDFCTPNINGTLQIADVDVTSGDVDDYSFTVYMGGSAPGDIMAPQPTTSGGGAVTSITFENLASGTYYVVAERVTPGPGFGCSSIPTLAEAIVDNSTNPTIVFSVQDNTSCDLNPDGTLTATIDAPAPSAGNYGFEWFIGNDTNPANAFNDPLDGTISSVNNVSSINNVAANTYTVRVTDPVSNCISTASFTVVDNLETPEILAHVPNPSALTACDPFNASIEITSVSIGIPSDYDYQWYASLADFNSGTPIPLETTELISNVGTGSYYVVATKKTIAGSGSGCTTPVYNVNVQDERVYPAPVLTLTANTACDLNFATGQINILVDSGAPGSSYDYVWVSGTAPGGGAIAAGDMPDDRTGVIAPSQNDQSWIDLQPGTYVIDIRNNDTGCMVRGTAEILDQPETIDIIGFTPTPLSSCDPLNAAIKIYDNQDIEINGLAQSFADLTLVMTDAGGTPLPNPPIAGTDAGGDFLEYQVLDFGSYFLTVTRLANGNVAGAGCSSPPLRIDLIDTRVYPTVAMSSTSNTACDLTGATGTIQAVVDQASPGTSYDYTWLSGTDPLGGAIAAGDMPADRLGVVAPNQNDQSWIDLLPGTYVIDIRNNDTGCTVQGSVEILDQPETIDIIGFTPTPLSSCDPLNAAIKIYDNQDIEINGLAQSFADLTLVMTDAGGAPLPNPPIAGTDAGGDFLEYQVLDFGTYFLTVTRLANGNVAGAGCSSPPLRIDVIDTRVYPTVAMSSTSNTACDLTGATGTIQAVVDQASPGTSYDYTWLSGTDPLGGAIAAGDMPVDRLGVVAPNQNDQSWIDLLPGTYVIDIRNNDTGCTVQGTVEILDQPETIDIIGFTPTPLSSCDPLNAAIKIYDNQDIEINGLAQSFADLTLVMTDAGGAPLPNPPIAGTDAGGDFLEYQVLDFGTYFLTVIRLANGNVAGAGCSSPPLRIDLIDTRVYPTVAMSSTSNTACDLAGATGTIQAVVDQASPGTSYDYTWLSGTDPLGGAIAAGDMPVDRLGVVAPNQNDQSWIDLLPGTYVIDIRNNDTGCTVQGTVEVFDQPETIDIIGFTPTPLSSCDPLNAAIKIYDNQDIEINGLAQSFADLTLVMTDAGGAPLPNPPIAGTDAGGDFLEYQVLDFGSYFLTVTRLANGNVAGAGCSSPPLRIDLIDTRVYPTVAMSSTSNTACDLTGATGTIQAVVDQAAPGTSYDYTWLSGTDPLGGAIAAGDMPVDRVGVIAPNQNDQSWIDLLPGTYVIDIRNNDTGCTVQGSVEILDQPTSIDVIQISPVNVTACDPNGAIKLYDNQDIVINGIPQSLTDLNIVLEDDLGNPVPNPPINGTDAGGDFVEFQTLDFGTYFLTVTRIVNGNFSGAGCSSPPVRVDLIDQRTFPELALTSTSNTACDLTFDGSFTINVADVPGSLGDGATYTYNILFEDGTVIANNATLNTGVDDLFPGIKDGTYSITATNEITNCQIQGDVTVEYRPQPIEILDINFEHQLICDADGLIEVIALDPANIADYTFLWYRGSYSPGSELVDGGANVIIDPLLDDNNYSSIGAGTYFVVAFRAAGSNPGAGCPSPPVRIDLEDLHVDPELSMSFTADSSCEPQFANGVVTAIANETDGSTTDTYQFDWTYNGIALLPGTVTQTDNANQSVLTGAPEGEYVVTVTNLSNTGCFYEQGITVTLVQPNSFPNVVDVDTIDPMDCNPTGRAEVTAIALGNSAPITDPVVLDSDFSYEWFFNDTDPGSQMLDLANNPIITRNLDDILPGKYYVIVQSQLTGCKGIAKEVEILEDDIIVPTIVITQTIPQISCVVPFTAELSAIADGFNDTNPDYSFEWYNSLDTSGPIIGTGSTLSALGAGEYSLEVFNSITGCSSSALYIIEDESVDYLPVIITSQNPLQSCVAPDGEAVANFQPIQGYPFTYDYTFDWWLGDNPDFSSAPLIADNPTASNLTDGLYTVRVTDNNSQCTQTALVEVLDDRRDPQLVINLDNPLINCDPAKPNGQLSLTIDGGQIASLYAIEWYAGSSASGPVLAITDILVGQTAGSYTASVTNKLTGCNTILNESITDGRVDPPSPDPFVVSHVTHCIVPNGIIDVTVGGATQGYNFSWYDGPTDNDANLSFNRTVFDLDIGIYAVTATDNVTGCVSPPSAVEVLDLTEIPELGFVSGPSFCETPTGFAEVKVINNVVGQSFDWVNLETGETGSGPGLYDVFAGRYEVTVTSVDGCVNIGEVEIGTEINGYQGISANGDGENDYFHIDCISNFPDNNVQIYNRVGVLVYEANGYNNFDVIFEGIGRNGLYLMGEDVPDGTYFYIIDKRDGSKQITGYLELIR